MKSGKNIKTIIFFLLNMLLLSCNTSKKNHLKTIALNSYIKCDCNLYVEVFRVGLLKEDKSDYLTDSVNFRFYTGTYDDERGMISYKCNGDSITITKSDRIDLVDYSFNNDTVKITKKPGYESSTSADTLKPIEIKSFSLRKLIRDHKLN